MLFGVTGFNVEALVAVLDGCRNKGSWEEAITARFILKSYVVDESKVQGKKIGKLQLEGAFLVGDSFRIENRGDERRKGGCEDFCFSVCALVISNLLALCATIARIPYVGRRALFLRKSSRWSAAISCLFRDAWYSEKMISRETNQLEKTPWSSRD